MSKTNEEIASDIVQALVQARGTAIAPCSANRADFIREFLSEEKIAEAYQTIFKAVCNRNGR